MEIFTYGEIPFMNSNVYFIYVAFLLVGFGYYLANYSKYRRIGIIISIISSLPLLFLFVFVVMNFIDIIIGPIDIVGPGG